MAKEETKKVCTKSTDKVMAGTGILKTEKKRGFSTPPSYIKNVKRV